MVYMCKAEARKLHFKTLSSFELRVTLSNIENTFDNMFLLGMLMVIITNFS